MRKAELEALVEKLRFKLEMSESRGVRLNNNASDLAHKLRFYKSEELKFNRALELMKLRENLTFEQALTALTQLEPKDEN